MTPIRPLRTSAAAALVVAGSVFVVSSASGQRENPPDPPGRNAATADELFAQLPDRVPVSYRDRVGSPGTISKQDYEAHVMAGSHLAPDEQPVLSSPIEVLDARGRLVGHMYPGDGFVSIEESADPGFDPTSVEARSSAHP